MVTRAERMAASLAGKISSPFKSTRIAFPPTTGLPVLPSIVGANPGSPTATRGRDSGLGGRGHDTATTAAASMSATAAITSHARRRVIAILVRYAARARAECRGRSAARESCAVVAAGADQKVEEVPLGHEGEEPAPRGQVSEVGEAHQVLADLAAQLADLLVRQPQPRIEQSQLVMTSSVDG